MLISAQCATNRGLIGLGQPYLTPVLNHYSTTGQGLPTCLYMAKIFESFGVGLSPPPTVCALALWHVFIMRSKGHCRVIKCKLCMSTEIRPFMGLHVARLLNLSSLKSYVDKIFDCGWLVSLYFLKMKLFFAYSIM